jgi:hypothetical protein
MWCIGKNIISKSNNQKNVLLKIPFYEKAILVKGLWSFETK